VRIAIVSVGDELLSGDTLNTNSAWLRQGFSGVGYAVVLDLTVPDDVSAIADALLLSARKADAVVIEGGLGPTSDDLTRDGIARAAGVELRREPDVEKRLREWYAARGRPVLDISLRMADVPAGAELLSNPAGQAPGLRLALGGCVVYAVPGVPAEMRAIVTESVLPDLLHRDDGASDIATTTLRIAVRGESEVATAVIDAGPTPAAVRVAYLPSPGDLRLRLTGPRALVEPYAALLRTVLGDIVYGEGEDTLDVVVHRLLAARGATVAVAESLTGGQLGQLLTAMPGSSATFVGGVVAYATQLKGTLLGVDAALLDKEGAVHPDVAQQMAAGIRDRLRATYGLSTTGVAGPEAADGPRGPMDTGLVYVAVVGPSESNVRALRLGGTRELVRTLTAMHALDLLRRTVTSGNMSG
jgi:nicotinamide-nucleotide amidase